MWFSYSLPLPMQNDTILRLTKQYCFHSICRFTSMVWQSVDTGWVGGSYQCVVQNKVYLVSQDQFCHPIQTWCGMSFLSQALTSHPHLKWFTSLLALHPFTSHHRRHKVYRYKVSHLSCTHVNWYLHTTLTNYFIFRLRYGETDIVTSNNSQSNLIMHGAFCNLWWNNHMPN